MENDKQATKRLVRQVTRAFDFLTTEELNMFNRTRNMVIKLSFLHSSAKREDDDRSEYINFFTKSHLKVKCPPKALFYFPSQEERIVLSSDETKNLRRIFEGDRDYTPFELAKIKEVKAAMDKLNQENNTDYNITDPQKWLEADTLRLLQATSFNIERSLSYITQNIDWRKENSNITLSSNGKKIIQLGFIYAHGRDNRYRPIVIMDPTIYLKHKEEFTFDEWLNAIIFLMDYFVNSHNVLVPGQVENWNMIVDMQNVSLMSIPSEFKDIMKVMSSNFRCRLYVNFLLNMSFIVRGLWAIIKTFLDPVSQKKVRILGGSSAKEIFEFINPSQVEEKLGGTAPNKTSDYFPPRIVPGETAVFPEDSKIYLSEEEYAAKVARNNYRRHPKFSKWNSFFSLEITK